MWSNDFPHENSTWPNSRKVIERDLGNLPAETRAKLVRGMVPDTLTTVSIDKVCYLAIDMNIVAPEIAALRYFWDKLVPGAVVVFDDYFNRAPDVGVRFAVDQLVASGMVGPLRTEGAKVLVWTVKR